MSAELTSTRAGRREWTGLAVLLLALLLVSMDVSVLYFAVPFISHDLEPSSTQQLWIFDIYGFVLAGTLITMGSLGDRIGRRRLLLVGAAAFGLTSIAAAYAPSAGALIGARAVLGISGATLMPSTLALIRNMFHDEKQRGTAIAIWTATLTLGISVGPILSGFLLEHFWWGSVFLINAPVMVLLLILAPALVPEFRHPGRGRFDLLSAVLSLAAVLPVIYGIKELAAHGPSGPRFGSIVVGLVIGLIFLRRQQTRPDPMIDLAIFRRGAFSVSLVLNLIAMFALVGFAIFTTQYLQLVRGMAPLEAALWSLVPSVFVGSAAPLASVLVKRGVPRWPIMSAGFLIAAVGFLGLAQVRAESALWFVIVAAGLEAAGLVVVMSLGTELVMTAVAPERAGSASALQETGSEFGGALGMALLGSVGTAVYRSGVLAGLPSGVPAPAASTARETLGGALAVADQLPAPLSSQVLVVARDAFLDGMHAAAIGAAALMAAGAVLSMVLLRRVRPSGSAGQPAAPAPQPVSVT